MHPLLAECGALLDEQAGERREEVSKPGTRSSAPSGVSTDKTPSGNLLKDACLPGGYGRTRYRRRLAYVGLRAVGQTIFVCGASVVGSGEGVGSTRTRGVVPVGPSGLEACMAKEESVNYDWDVTSGQDS